MKIFIVMIISSLMLCNEIVINIVPELDILDKKVIDSSIKDGQYDYALQTFLIAVDENQEIDIDFNVSSNRVIRNVDRIDPIFLDAYTKHVSHSDNGDQLSYYISEPMYMRGVRIVQIAVSPYEYIRDSQQIILYNDLE